MQMVQHLRGSGGMARSTALESSDQRAGSLKSEQAGRQQSSNPLLLARNSASEPAHPNPYRQLNPQSSAQVSLLDVNDGCSGRSKIIMILAHAHNSAVCQHAMGASQQLHVVIATYTSTLIEMELLQRNSSGT